MADKTEIPKYRHEYKYLCNSVQASVLKTRVGMLMARDSHTGKYGNYRIRSLYFDDWDDRCYYENESGIGERAKYRIRIYNGDSKRITLEKKSKSRGMTLKTMCLIDEQICRQMMEGRVAVQKNMTVMQKSLIGEMQLKNMRPVVIVEYVRIPFIEQNGNVRVTFDEAISSSNEIKNFFEKNIAMRPILEAGQSVLEIKWDEFLPDYIKNHLQLDSLSQTSFSKYYLCRKYNTYGGARV